MLFSEEMYFFKLLVHDVEDIKGNLSASREREAVFRELLSQHLHKDKGGVNTVLLGPTSVSQVEGTPKYIVIGLEVFAFLISTRV